MISGGRRWRRNSPCRSAVSRPAGCRQGGGGGSAWPSCPRSASAAARCRRCRSPTTRSSPPRTTRAWWPPASCASGVRARSHGAASTSSTSLWRHGRRGQVAVGRQPAEVHRRPRDPAGPAPARMRAAHLGRGRRRRRLHPPADHRPAQPRLRGAGDLGGARRAVRDLRPIAVIAKGRLSPVRAARDTSIEDIGVWMAGCGRAPSTLPARPRDGDPHVELEARAEPSRLMAWSLASAAGGTDARRRPGGVRRARQGPGRRLPRLFLNPVKDLYALPNCCSRPRR